jgi:competence protein ComGC
LPFCSSTDDCFFFVKTRHEKAKSGKPTTPSATSRRGCCAFTIIEVLVIVAIIALLVTMILPMFETHGPAFTVRCMSNQRQVAIAAVMYSEDSKGRFPNLDSLPANDGPAALSLLLHYESQTNTFICPFVARQREKDRPWYRARFVPQLNRAFFQSNGNDYAYYDGLTNGGYTNVILADRFAWTNRSLLAPQLLSHPGGRINACLYRWAYRIRSFQHGSRRKPQPALVRCAGPSSPALRDSPFEVRSSSLDVRCSPLSYGFA